MKRLKTVRWTVAARTIWTAMTAKIAQLTPANWDSALMPGPLVVKATVAVVRVAQTILTALLPAYKKAHYAPMTASVAPAGAKMENASNSVRISRR